MSSDVRRKQETDTIHEERVPPLNPTRLKIAALVLGLFFGALAITFHFLHINCIATYSTAALSGAFILGAGIWTFVNCIQQAKERAEDTRYNIRKETQRIEKLASDGKTEELSKALEEKTLAHDLDFMLIGAAKKGHIETVKLLLEKGANPNKTPGAYTALHYAILATIHAKNGLKDAYQVTKALLEKHPNLIHIKGSSDKSSQSLISPLKLAEECLIMIQPQLQPTDPDLIQLLKDYGAK